MLWAGVLQLVALSVALLVLLALISLRPMQRNLTNSTMSTKRSSRKMASDGALLTRRQRASILSLRLVPKEPPTLLVL